MEGPQWTGPDRPDRPAVARPAVARPARTGPDYPCMMTDDDCGPTRV